MAEKGEPQGAQQRRRRVEDEACLALVEAEPDTTTWFALRFGVDTFGIFDAFPDDAARQAHLVGKVAAALKDNEYLFEGTPQLETADVLAAKIPSKV